MHVSLFSFMVLGNCYLAQLKKEGLLKAENEHVGIESKYQAATSLPVCCGFFFSCPTISQNRSAYFRFLLISYFVYDTVPPNLVGLGLLQ